MKKILTLVFLLIASVTSFFITDYWRTHKAILIVGCARSGTNYIANALKQGGVKIGHERMKRDGLSSWDLAADTNQGRWKVQPYKYKFAHIFHQVRDPLKCISSVYTTEDENSWRYILAHTPQIRADDPHLVKCAKYWYYWNLKAEEKAEWTYRIEDIDLLWNEFEKRLGKKINRKAIQVVPKDANTKGAHKRDFTWEDLRKELDADLFDKIQSLAKKYGYNLN